MNITLTPSEPERILKLVDQNGGEAQLAVSGNKLTIFGSRMGYLGPVLMDYTEFENEAEAIADAWTALRQLGVKVDPQVSRPRITKFSVK